ncbi:MAG: hypothetical protein NWQ37_15440, partial [Marivita lacus]|nr:hypothetical protein [Marivita lacus]
MIECPELNEGDSTDAPRPKMAKRETPVVETGLLIGTWSWRIPFFELVMMAAPCRTCLEHEGNQMDLMFPYASTTVMRCRCAAF